MAHSNAVIESLRIQLKGAHDWLEGTLMGVDDEIGNSLPLQVVATIGAQYAHVVLGEDYFVNALLKGAAPFSASQRTGVSSPPPPGPWGEWGRSVTVDIAALHIFAQQVYTASDAWLASISDADLTREVETPAGKLPLANFIGLWILNAHTHAGEISCLKGLHGMQGYPG